MMQGYTQRLDGGLACLLALVLALLLLCAWLPSFSAHKIAPSSQHLPSERGWEPKGTFLRTIFFPEIVREKEGWKYLTSRQSPPSSNERELVCRQASSKQRLPATIPWKKEASCVSSSSLKPSLSCFLLAAALAKQAKLFFFLERSLGRSFFPVFSWLKAPVHIGGLIQRSKRT